MCKERILSYEKVIATGGKSCIRKGHGRFCTYEINDMQVCSEMNDEMTQDKTFTEDWEKQNKLTYFHMIEIKIQYFILFKSQTISLSSEKDEGVF